MNGAFRRRAQEARVCQIAGPLVSVKWALEGDTAPTKPHILTALGLNQVYVNSLQDHLPPWIDIRAAAIIAEHFVSHTFPRDMVKDSATRRALVMGELSAVWAVKQTISPDVINASRATIELALRSYPPAPTQMTASVAHFLKTIHDTPQTTTVSKQDFCDKLGIDVNDNYPTEYSTQKLHWFKCRGNMIRWVDLFEIDAAFVPLFIELNDLTKGAYVVLPAIGDITTQADYRAKWSTMTTDECLGFFEMMRESKNRDTRAGLIAATFAAIALLAKSGNVSEEWVTDRVARIEAVAPGLKLDSWLNYANLTRYMKLYPHDHLTNDDIYAMLQGFYRWFTADNIGPFQWIIEQAALSNISMAIGFAEAVVKPTINPIRLIRTFIGDQQLAVVAQIAGASIYDRFGSLASTPHHMKTYPDLAFIGRYITITGCDKKANTYSGDPTPYLTKTVVELKAICKIILMSGFAGRDMELAQTLSIKEELRAVGILERDGVYYRIPKPSDPSASDPPETAAAQRTKQDDWLKLFAGEKLKSGSSSFESVEVSPLSVFEERNAAMSTYDKQYRVIMQEFVKAAQQIKLTCPTDGRINWVQRRVKFSTPLAEAFVACKIPTDPAWLADPPVIPAINEDRTLSDKDYTLLSRMQPPNRSSIQPLTAQTTPGTSSD